MHTFILVEELSAAFIIGFDFVVLYKQGLYWEGEGKGYSYIGNEHVELECIDLVNSQVS